MAHDLGFQRTETAVHVPPVERAFVAFSSVVTALQFVFFIPDMQSIRIWPYVGWVFGMAYMTAAFMWPSLYQRPVRTLQTLRVTLSVQCLILLFYAAYGVADFVMFHHMSDETNPMLRYSPVRPLWTVLIPSVWAVLLWRARPPRENEA